MKTPPFNELKATQAAAVLLRSNNGPMKYLKLIKLLYNANRLSMERKGRPIYFDALYSMEYGQVPSLTLNCVNNDSFVATTWRNFIHTRGKDVVLNEYEFCDVDELSRADIAILHEVFNKYKVVCRFDMSDEHHEPERFPEWVDVTKMPGTRRVETSYEDLLKILNYTDEDIEEIQKNYSELALLESL